MKKIIISTVLLATLTAVQAQEAEPSGKATLTPNTTELRAQEHTDRLIRELGITAEQAENVRLIEDKHMKGVVQLRASGAQGDSATERMRMLQEKRDHALKAVLTEQQFKKMEALRQAKKERPSDDAEKMPPAK